MITVEEATRMILDHPGTFDITATPIDRATGRILKEDLVADRDFPPYDRVAMDGIAILYSGYQAGRRLFEIQGIAPAGAPRVSLENPEGCVEVMTGAILPDNTDTVVRYEDTHIENGQARITIDDLDGRINIHYRGEDRKRGDVVVPKGQVLSPAEISVAATIGKSMIQTVSMPDVTVVTTGDEIVPVDKVPLVHQIRGSNVYTIQAALNRCGIKVHRIHLPDDKAEIRKQLNSIIDRGDVLILSGGVSKGKYDFVPDVLEEIGVRKRFHRVRQRPGKPFWFGLRDDGLPVFALPGNPVSATMCAYRYVIPWFYHSAGVAQKTRRARLAEDVIFRPDLVYFLQVRTTYTEAGVFAAQPVSGGGSGDLAKLADSDGFIELPRGRDHFKAGEVFPYHAFR